MHEVAQDSKGSFRTVKLKAEDAFSVHPRDLSKQTLAALRSLPIESLRASLGAPSDCVPVLLDARAFAQGRTSTGPKATARSLLPTSHAHLLSLFHPLPPLALFHSLPPPFLLPFTSRPCEPFAQEQGLEGRSLNISLHFLALGSAAKSPSSREQPWPSYRRCRDCPSRL